MQANGDACGRCTKSVCDAAQCAVRWPAVRAQAAPPAAPPRLRRSGNISHPAALPRQFHPTRTPPVLTHRHTALNCASAPTCLPPLLITRDSGSLPTLACRTAPHTHPSSTQLHPRAIRWPCGAHPSTLPRDHPSRHAVAAGEALGRERHTHQPLPRRLWVTEVTNRCPPPLRPPA
jgi:hypothetical protein